MATRASSSAGALSALPTPTAAAPCTVTPEKNDTIVKSARNIPGVLTTPATILSVYDLLNAKYLVVDQRALATIEEVFA